MATAARPRWSSPGRKSWPDLIHALLHLLQRVLHVGALGERELISLPPRMDRECTRVTPCTTLTASSIGRVIENST